MHKKILFLLLLLIVLIAPQPSSAVKIFMINETEKLSLAPVASDPDKDIIDIQYSLPLDSNGEWQTTYGDAGQYNVTINVSDGESTAVEEALIIVNKKEDPPVILSSAPEQESLEIDEADTARFSIEAQDPNKDDLKYRWFLDGSDVAESKEFAYKTTYDDAGEHNITAVVSDSKSETKKEWKLKVNNIDIEGMIESIGDIIINEGQAAKIELPDFEKYGLEYGISEPLGSKNYWKTGLDDAGIHNVTLRVYSDKFDKEKIIMISVHNVDRPPSLGDIGIKSVYEGQQLQFELKAKDPDGDIVKFSASDLPEGAELEGSIFTWTPGFDTVKHEGLFGNILEKFRVLQKTFFLEFAAQSNDLRAIMNMPVVVWDVNRQPKLEKIDDINITEGDVIHITPRYSDPDNDKVYFSYSGWLTSNTYQTTFDDQGTYYVKVTVTDGLLENSAYARINVIDRNREPEFLPIQKMEVFENQASEIRLGAADKDNDQLIFSIKNPPKNSKLADNIFTWTPPYGFASNESKAVELEFEVSDGKSTAVQKASVEVINKNQPPDIISAEPENGAEIKLGQPVIFYINAEDKDNDKLTYAWDFGFFDKYKTGPKLKRIFSSKGAKKIKVIVSDGNDAVEHVWSVEVD